MFQQQAHWLLMLPRGLLPVISQQQPHGCGSLYRQAVVCPGQHQCRQLLGLQCCCISSGCSSLLLPLCLSRPAHHTARLKPTAALCDALVAAASAATAARQSVVAAGRL